MESLIYTLCSPVSRLPSWGTCLYSCMTHVILVFYLQFKPCNPFSHLLIANFYQTVLLTQYQTMPPLPLLRFAANHFNITPPPQFLMAIYYFPFRGVEPKFKSQESFAMCPEQESKPYEPAAGASILDHLKCATLNVGISVFDYFQTQPKYPPSFSLDELKGAGLDAELTLTPSHKPLLARLAPAGIPELALSTFTITTASSLHTHTLYIRLQGSVPDSQNQITCSVVNGLHTYLCFSVTVCWTPTPSHFPREWDTVMELLRDGITSRYRTDGRRRDVDLADAVIDLDQLQ